MVMTDPTIFATGMACTDTIYLTELQREVEGDIFFPEIPADFEEVSCQPLEAKEPLLFKVYRRKGTF